MPTPLRRRATLLLLFSGCFAARAARFRSWCSVTVTVASSKEPPVGVEEDFLRCKAGWRNVARKLQEAEAKQTIWFNTEKKEDVLTDCEVVRSSEDGSTRSVGGYQWEVAEKCEPAAVADWQVEVVLPERPPSFLDGAHLRCSVARPGGPDGERDDVGAKLKQEKEQNVTFRGVEVHGGLTNCEVLDIFFRQYQDGWVQVTAPRQITPAKKRGKLRSLLCTNALRC